MKKTFITGFTIMTLGVTLLLTGCPPILEPPVVPTTVDTPVITSPQDGPFVTDSKEISLSCGTQGATIYYTLDESDPTISSSLFLTSFSIETTTTVKAIAVKEGYFNSKIATAIFIKEVKILPYSLNVVYFIPNDIEAPAEYERRISELMLWAQNFYAENMEKNGFGRRNFGLRMSSKDRVKITTINGKFASTSYPYNGGHGSVIQEVDTYFRIDSEEKKSDHILIIIPSYDGSLNPGGPPFYGVGRNCYALDYDDMDIKYLGEFTQKGNLLTKWFGGLLHELGHGLNLPHNSQWVSQLENPNFGTALMGAGNHTLGQRPTFITKASLAILNNCQVFATEEKEFYGTNGIIELERFSIEHKTKAIHIQGKYKNITGTINAVNIYIDDHPLGGAADYDAESWCITDLTNNEFNIEIPLDEITKDNNDGLFTIRTWLLFDNGTIFEENHNFDRNNLENYSFITEKDLPKTNWNIIASDAAGNSPATQLLDNDITTIWHSQWNGEKLSHPHTITVDMQERKTIKGISFQQRQGFHGAINEFELEISEDGTNWKMAGTHNLLKTTRKQFIYFPEASSVKEFKIKTISNYTSSDPSIATLAEIGAFE